MASNVARAQHDQMEELVANLAESFNLDIPLVRDVLDGEQGDEARCIAKLQMLSAGSS